MKLVEACSMVQLVYPLILELIWITVWIHQFKLNLERNQHPVLGHWRHQVWTVVCRGRARVCQTTAETWGGRHRHGYRTWQHNSNNALSRLLIKGVLNPLDGEKTQECTDTMVTEYSRSEKMNFSVTVYIAFQFANRVTFQMPAILLIWVICEGFDTVQHDSGPRSLIPILFQSP